MDQSNIRNQGKKYLIIYGRKLDRLHRPSTNLNRYDNEAYMMNPLFQVSNVSKQNWETLRKKRAAEMKLKLACKPLPPELDIRCLPQSHYVQNLRKAMQNASEYGKANTRYCS